MSLPKSLGDPAVSAEQLLEESRAIANPYGVDVLKIQPAQYEDIAKDTGALKTTLREQLKDFFHYTAKGDAAKEAGMNAAVFEGDGLNDFKENREYLFTRTAMSALNPNYGDAHALCVQEKQGSEPLAGVIIMPRAEHSFAVNAQNATGVKGDQFGPSPAPNAQLSFMTIWHEYSHAAGADEAQADKMSAIVTRKAFPGSNALQVYADLRAIDSLLDYDSKPREFPPNKKGEIDIMPARHDIYGWRLVDAVDSVAKMPESEIQAMTEADIRKIVDTPIPNSKHAALARVGDALKAENPDLIKHPTKENPETSNLHDVGEALNKLLKSGKFDNDPDAQAIAKRSLLAISRVALDGPELGAELGVTSRFMQQKETPAVASATHKQTLKTPSL